MPPSCDAKVSRRWRCRGAGIEQAMHMDDEIAHLGVVHGSLRHPLPGLVGFGVARIDADDVEVTRIGELDGVERGELAAKHEVQELLGGSARDASRGHDRSLKALGHPRCHCEKPPNASFTLSLKRFGSLL